MKHPFFTAFSLLFYGTTIAQELKPFPVTQNWLSKIEALAPSSPRIAVKKQKKVLIFSLHTGFNHWIIPHTEAVMKILGTQSGAFQMTSSSDISEFEKENLKKYDAIILNNNCSKNDSRNLFSDQLTEDTALDSEQKIKKAEMLEHNLLHYVENGGGLMVLHGGISMLNSSEKFEKMIGGSFDYHPKQQKLQIEIVDTKHPLTQAFNGNSFEVFDEAYIFGSPYSELNFHPLLYMEKNKITGLKAEDQKNNKEYISWIKKHGKGKVFYSMLTHNAQNYDNANLLQFLLDGMRYVVGDLKCDDAPIFNKEKN